MTTEELASREDGLVSPVDVQVLSWMLLGQRESGKAFDRVSFQKLGGVEGLLTSFLERTLAARESAARREAAIKRLRREEKLELIRRRGSR